MCGCTSTPCGCETPNIPRGPRGFAGPAGPAPNFEVSVTPLPAGQDAQASVTGTSPNLTLNLSIPAGATGPAGPAGSPGGNGVNGVDAFTSLTSPFVQPTPGGTATITVGNTSWMSLGSWLYIAGGGWYIVASNPLSSTQIVVKNPGASDLAVIWPGGPTSIPQNAAATSTITPSGFANQVQPAGIPGVKGANGAAGSAGLPGVIQVVNAIPVAAPPPNETFKIYTDSSTNPTVVTGYSWNGVSWVATANLTPVAGSQIYQTTAAPLAGVGKNGDWAFSTTTLAVYYKSAGTWTNPFNLTATFTQVATNSGGDMGTVPVRTPRIVGFDPVASSFAAPTTYTIDLAYQAHHIQIDKNLTLNWDDTNFAYSGVWELQVENTDPGAINIILTAGQFAENAGLAIVSPIALAGGDTRAFVFRKNMVGDRLIIENTYLVNNL